MHNIADSCIMADDGSLCTSGDKYLSSTFLVLQQEAFSLSFERIFSQSCVFSLQTVAEQFCLIENFML